MNSTLLVVGILLLALCASAKQVSRKRFRKDDKEKRPEDPWDCSNKFRVTLSLFNNDTEKHGMCKGRDPFQTFVYKTCTCVPAKQSPEIFEVAFVDVPSSITRAEGCLSAGSCHGVRRYFSEQGACDNTTKFDQNYAPQIFDVCQVDPEINGTGFKLQKIRS